MVLLSKQSQRVEQLKKEMDFLEMDRKERDKIVNDYVATLHQLQKQNEDEKTFGLQHRKELERTFNPIIEATKQSTDTLKKH